jgi:hypothetical protein
MSNIKKKYIYGSWCDFFYHRINFNIVYDLVIINDKHSRNAFIEVT